MLPRSVRFLSHCVLRYPSGARWLESMVFDCVFLFLGSFEFELVVTGNGADGC